MLFNLVQPTNALSPMVVKPSGRLMLVRNLLPAMPDLPMERSVEGRVIEEKCVPQRAESSITWVPSTTA